jgi:hypothetical protein
MLVYAGDAVSYANAPSMTGQVLACGGVAGTNGFLMYYSPVAAEQLPGAGTPSPPTVVVEDKYGS